MFEGRKRQSGLSALGSIIVLFLVVYGGWLGIQYAPIWLEARSVESTLDTVRSEHRRQPLRTVHDASVALARVLNINEMNDKSDLFSVQQRAEGIAVRAEYTREMNLLFSTRQLHYEKYVVLR